MILLFLLGWPWAPPVEKPLVEKRADGVLVLALGTDLWEQPDVDRQLRSGLTTSVEIRATLKGGRQKQAHFSLVEIRYDLWQESYSLWARHHDDREVTEMFATRSQLLGWLGKPWLTVARLPEIGETIRYQLKLKLRVLPFSSAEERRAKEWFAELVSIPDAGERGKKRQQRNGGQAEDKGIDAFFAGGIVREAIATYEWSWVWEVSR